MGTEYVALIDPWPHFWDGVEETEDDYHIQRLVWEIIEEFKEGEVVPSVQIPEDLVESVLALAEEQGKETLAIMAAFEEIQDP